VRSARQGAKLTQEALAKRLGLSRTSVTNIERGTQHIPIHVLFDLARALGVGPAELLPPDQPAAPAGASRIEEMLNDLPQEFVVALRKSVESTFTDPSQRESVYQVVRQQMKVEEKNA
jgi:transcriptional regulator with XRE-family HTH domain